MGNVLYLSENLRVFLSNDVVDVASEIISGFKVPPAKWLYISLAISSGNTLTFNSSG
jgi:hypothetical protein